MLTSVRVRRRVAVLAGAGALATALLVAGSALTQKAHRGRVEAPASLVAASASAKEAALELVYQIAAPNGDRTTVLATRAAQPTTGRELFAIDHAEGYAPRASLSPDGAHVVLTNLAPGEGHDAPAELVLFDRASGARRVIARDAHYFTRPVFSAAGRSVFYMRRALAPEPPDDAMKLGHPREVHDELCRLDLASGQVTVLLRDTLVDLALLGLDRATGEVVVARRTQAGADVAALDPRTGTPRLVASAPSGRSIEQASLDASGAWVLLTEHVATGGDALLLRVPVAGGAPEALGSAPVDEPPAHLASDLLVRTVGADLVLDPVGAAPPRALHPPRAGAKDAGLVALSPGGRFAVARWLDGATQAYAIVDAESGAMRALPPPKGGDLYGLVAEVVGFAQPASATNGGAP